MYACFYCFDCQTLFKDKDDHRARLQYIEHSCKKMTVVTPEMEKKQEEAMDKFLAKQVAKRYQELRMVKRGFNQERLRKLDPGNHPVSTRFHQVQKGKHENGNPIYVVEQVPDWKPATDSAFYYRCSFLYGPELCYKFLELTYIPLAKYHARTYKKEEERVITNPLNLSLELRNVSCWSAIEHKYVTMTKLGLLDKKMKNDPSVNKLHGSSGDRPNRILSECWVPGFDYLSGGYFISPEGWTPPPEWGVEDNRPKKKEEQPN